MARIQNRRLTARARTRASGAGFSLPDSHRARLACCLAAIALSAAALCAAPLPAEIEKILAASPAVQRGFLGIRILDLATGKPLYESNAGRLFVPASNWKLFTAALALARLGPDYRFQTKVIAPGGLSADGLVAGPLILVGGGDPNLSGREIPYRVDSPRGEGLRAIEDLAAQIAARGVRRIDGDIVGDDTAFEWEPYPEGWSLDDSMWEYGAPVSALSINDNAFVLTVRPGDPARIAVAPAFEFYQIDNQVQPGSPRKLRIEREPGSRQIRVSGRLPLAGGAESHLLAIHDPALYAAAALRDALARRGIAVRGEAVARHTPNGDPAAPVAGVELAARESAPLIENLRIASKVSQNLHTELILRAVARARRGHGTLEAGLAEMQTFLREIGVAPSEFRANDASGLSRMNLVTPGAVVKLLEFMYRSPHRETWMGLLPVGGEDGTLKGRLRDTGATGRIRAKTGALTNVAALSGYAQRKDGAMLAFSLLSNNQNAPSAEVRAVLDKICVLMTD